MTFPTDLRETVVLMLSDNLKDMKPVDTFAKATDDQLFSYHFGLGMSIRNHYKLWDENTFELNGKKVKIEHDDFFPPHPDDISYIWLQEAQRLINAEL